MLIDTHCHLDFKDFDADRSEVIKRSKEKGIMFIINVGSSLEGTKRSIELAKENDFIYASAGIHPHDADNVKEKDIERFKNMLNHRKIVAIGEIGLDYYRSVSSKESQRELFIELLELAKTKNLPLIIHNRDAHNDTLSILKDTIGKTVKGVMHCFSGDEKFLWDCLGMGMFVSFTCNLTFKNAESLRSLAKIVPMDRLLLETDAPFLAPQAMRGKRNEPLYIRYLAEELARLKTMDFEEVACTTTANAIEFFGLK